MKFAVLVFVFLWSFSTKAQQVVEVRGSTIDIGVFVDGLDNSKYKGVDGSPYLDPEFVPAKINALEKTQFIRFNIVDQIVEVKIKANKVVMLDLKNDFEIQILNESGKKYTTAMYTIDGKRIKSYFEVLKEGEKYGLYKQNRKKFLKEQKAEGYQDKLPPRFVKQDPVFYISDSRSNSGSLIELPTKRKKFIAFLEAREKDVKSFMKQKKLDFKEEEDLIKIMDFVFSEGE